jgi:signal transduction histidine kinase
VRLFASSPIDRLSAALVIGVFTAVGVLSWFGYRVIEEWRTTALQLAERRSSDAADLLQEAFARDMSGVQESILNAPEWSQFPADHPHEINDVVSSAFARYPYPETFFTWRDGMPLEGAVFFNRADRRPAWATGAVATTLFPVLIDREPTVARAILEKIALDTAAGRRLSVSTFRWRGSPYQVIAQIFYRDVYRSDAAMVAGFIVNMAWVRSHYFADLTTQVWNIGPGSDRGLALSVTDQQGALVAGEAITDRSALTHRRRFMLAFYDPESDALPSTDWSPEQWTVAVTSARDPGLFRSLAVARNILIVGAISALTLAFGLTSMVRAGRAGAHLAEMRSDFVSTVTHELKTPIATIKAAAETLSRDRLTGMSIQTCARIVTMEARRLTRLVDNLLAYSRITDTADTYSFEPVSVAAIFNDVQEDFEALLDQSGFALEIEIEPGTGSVTGDRMALRLLLNNLVDNAVKYSGTNRTLLLHAIQSGREILVDVVDTGIGIPPEDVAGLTRKFVRGRNAPPGGSGLGLAIASRIAKDHGGRLTILSAVGKGTTVTVALPAA